MALLRAPRVVLADGDGGPRLSRRGTSRSHDGNIKAANQRSARRGWQAPLTAGGPDS